MESLPLEAKIVMKNDPYAFSTSFADLGIKDVGVLKILHHEFGISKPTPVQVPFIEFLSSSQVSVRPFPL